MSATTKDYALRGVGCAHCASKIEDAVGRLDGVLSATYIHASAKLRVVTSAPGDMRSEIERIARMYEPTAQVLESAVAFQRHEEKAGGNKAALLLLVSGAAMFLAGILAGIAMPPPWGGRAALALFAGAYLLLGSKVLLRMARNLFKGRIFDENFLMGVATLGAIAIGKYAEAVTVMLFYQIGEFFQEMAVAKSRKRIGDLMDIRPDYANLKIDGRVEKVAPETVLPGDIFIVKPGEKIPLDGVIEEGEAMLDTAALTGESIPRKARAGDAVISGCINLSGALTIRATQTFGESTVAKILALVESAAGKKAPIETFITKFARYYTPAVVSFAALLAVIPPLFFSGLWSDWIGRALIFLVISCPCALVVSIPLGFFGGIGGASRRGILVKGGNFLEALANLDIAVFDKTGTLTRGEFKVREIRPAAGLTITEDELLEMAAVAEAFSNHPIALSIIKEYGKEIDRESIERYEEIPGLGVSAIYKGRAILAGNESLMDKAGVARYHTQGIGTQVHVALDGEYAGFITIADAIKPESQGLVESLKKLGVRKTVMLTGDAPEVARAVAQELGLDEFYAGLLPQHKVEKVEAL
ncbi:MAG: cadmium-translocating P-type ATPase, partial [Treponema sp.]|nr:cadmium-translocating P-type ATPase [Treponema sp.]